MSTAIETVGLIGLGALGVLFGERLVSTGAHLRVVADETRAARYRREGLRCNGCPVVFDIVTPKQAHPVDLMIFSTKAGGLVGAMDTAAGFIGPDTRIISVLNGVSSEEILSERFGGENVLYCVAQGMDAVKEGNALTYVHPGMIVIGEREPGPVTPRVQAVADFLNAHGIVAQPVEDMVRRQWSKLMLNAGVNQVVMVFEGTYGTVQAEGKPREMMFSAMREVQKLAALEGYGIDDAEWGDWITLIDSLSPSGKPSMRQDGEAHRPSEVELFAGTVIRLTQRHDLPVPVNQWLYDTVKQMEAAYAAADG